MSKSSLNKQVAFSWRWQNLVESHYFETCVFKKLKKMNKVGMVLWYCLLFSFLIVANAGEADEKGSSEIKRTQEIEKLVARGRTCPRDSPQHLYAFISDGDGIFDGSIVYFSKVFEYLEEINDTPQMDVVAVETVELSRRISASIYEFKVSSYNNWENLRKLYQVEATAPWDLQLQENAALEEIRLLLEYYGSVKSAVSYAVHELVRIVYENCKTEIQEKLEALRNYLENKNATLETVPFAIVDEAIQTDNFIWRLIMKLLHRSKRYGGANPGTDPRVPLDDILDALKAVQDNYARFGNQRDSDAWLSAASMINREILIEMGTNYEEMYRYFSAQDKETIIDHTVKYYYSK